MRERENPETLVKKEEAKEAPPEAVVGQPVIGRASATETDPNTSDRFSFWLAPEVTVNPFDIVEAEQRDGSRTFGIVLNLEHRTDAPSHLANFISNNFGMLVEEPQTPRQGTTVAKVAVLSNDRDIYMPIPSEARVRFATEEGIHRALGIDAMPERRRIPAGLIRLSNDTKAVAYIDLDYLLGPESAHVNISGISGLATKTSYAMFLIQAILQKVEASKIAVIALNVKHGDLLTIDQEVDGLDPEQHEMWDALGLEPKPFENVHYILPRAKGVEDRPNSFYIPDQYVLYGYSLDDAKDKLDLLFSHVHDPTGTMESLIGEIQVGLTEGRPPWDKVYDWNSLLNRPPLFDPEKREVKAYGDIHRSSVRKFRRHLRRMVVTRQSGIFVGQRSKNVECLSDIISEIQGGHIYVVDIAKLTDDEQTLVFGDILRTVYSLYAEAEEGEREDLPEKVIIFVDELNKYAPKGERGSPILDQVIDIAERGRSLGVILFSAQQFMSAVHPRVVGNCATTVIGRSGSAELADQCYRFLDPDVRMNITRLKQGELVLSHAIYRQPVKITFPKPAYRQPGRQ